MVAVQLPQYLSLQWKRYNYSLVFHGYALNHCQFVPNWPFMFHTQFSIFFVWPALNYVYFQPLEECILLGCCLHILYWCAPWYICWCDDGMHIYVHANDFLVHVFVWWFWDKQSAVCRSGPGLHIRHTLYWWMHSMLFCKCWDQVATSLLIIDTNGLRSVMTDTSFSRPCRIPMVFHSILP